MSERPPDYYTLLENAWSNVVGGMGWLKSVLFGEFSDHRPLSAIVADMLINFIPGVVIVTSARDAIAIILRLATHPEKREDLMEWVLLSACLIVIALPVAMAAGGAAAAGVGAVVGGIAGTELGAALRAVMLMLIKEASHLVELVRFLQKFIKGDILKFLRLVKFSEYEKPLLLALKRFIGKLIEIVKALRIHLESLHYFDSVRSTIVKLAEWERRFYAVQQDALKQMPKAMTELDARLAKVLAQTRPQEMHIVPAGVAADKTAALLPVKQRVRDTPGKLLANVEDEVSTGASKRPKGTSASASPTANKVEAKQSKTPNQSVKEKPAPLEPHNVGANTKKQDIAEPKKYESGKLLAPPPRYLPGISENDILNMPKGSRPDPATYLDSDYISKHLQTFRDEGGGFLFTDADIANPKYTSFNPTKFVMAGSDLRSVVTKYQATGDVTILEKALGYDPGYLAGKDIYMLELDNPKVVMPTGNEGGANSLWRPGGLTYPGGMREGVLDNVPIFHGNDPRNLPKAVKIQ